MKINPDCKVCGNEMFRMPNGHVHCLNCKIKKHEEKYGSQAPAKSGPKPRPDKKTKKDRK